MARPVELHRCPSRLDRSATTGTRQQSWCDHDLTEVATVAAPAHQVQAHQLLHSWAPGPAEHATACGIAITHRIGFQALVELSRCRQRSGRQPARPGQRPARSCCQASDGRPRARPTHSECCCGCRSRAAGDRRGTRADHAGMADPVSSLQPPARGDSATQRPRPTAPGPAADRVAATPAAHRLPQPPRSR